MTRTAHKIRQKQHPKDPQGMDLVYDEWHIPLGFLQADIDVSNRRHLVIVTPQKLKILHGTGTLSCAGPPFSVQLFMINASVLVSGDSLSYLSSY